MERVLLAVGRFVERDKGQDLLEYALLVALIAIVAVAAVTRVGTTISSVFWGYIAATPI
jgi:Flp pilus assembly pilin Flp